MLLSSFALVFLKPGPVSMDAETHSTYFQVNLDALCMFPLREVLISQTGKY